MGSDSSTVTMLRTHLSLILILGVALAAGGTEHRSLRSQRSTVVSGASGDDVGNLIQDLFKLYNKNAIPLPDDGPVNVEIGVSLINMNLARQVMSATAWVRMRWNDYRLIWDPTDFGGLDVIRVPGHMIWTPDLEVYNAGNFGDSSFHDRMGKDSFLHLIYWNGTVLSVPAVPISAICAEADMTLPETAAQSCNIKMGSWTYDGDHIKLTPYNSRATNEILDHIDLSEMRNSAWVITSQKNNVLKSNTYPGVPGIYYAMEYEFQMQKAYIYDDDEVNGIENPDLAETLSGIYYRYRHGDNMVVL